MVQNLTDGEIMDSTLYNKEELVDVDMDTLLVKDADFHRVKTENIKTVEDVAAILEAMKFHLQVGHPEFENLKKRDLI